MLDISSDNRQEEKKKKKVRYLVIPLCNSPPRGPSYSE